MPELVPTLTLSSGTVMPQLALGTWPMDDDEVAAALRQAVEVGYRHVDTAENYRNERGVGQAIRDCGLPREDIFVTTKFNKEWHTDPGAGLAGSLERLGLEHVDLVLIHWPNPQHDAYLRCWEGLIRLREQGLTRAIGTSNFKPQHLDRLISVTGVAPEVNQVEMHPWCARVAERAYHAEHGIITEAWSPLGRGRGGPLEAEAVEQIAEAHGRTPGQVALRWAVQQGAAAAPKSADRKRQEQNLAVFDFSLSEDEISALNGLQAPADYTILDSDTFGH